MNFFSNNKPNIIHLEEKKYNLKFKRGGSDLNKNNEIKRTSNSKANTTGGLLPNGNLINYSSKEKKLISKNSVEKITKVNKEGLNMNSLNSKIFV